MRISALTFIFLILSLGAQASEKSFAPKLSVRLNNGIISNSGSVGGSTALIGGVNVSYNHFVSENISVGGGFFWNFDYTARTIPVSGFEAGVRYYFIGQGTRSTFENELGIFKRRSGTAIYAAGELSQQKYYTGSNPPEVGEAILTGSSIGLNAGIGLDQRISESLDFTMEGNMGLLSFASTDDRFRLSSMLFKVGVSYVW